MAASLVSGRARVKRDYVSLLAGLARRSTTFGRITLPGAGGGVSDDSTGGGGRGCRAYLATDCDPLPRAPSSRCRDGCGRATCRSRFGAQWEVAPQRQPRASASAHVKWAAMPASCGFRKVRWQSPVLPDIIGSGSRIFVSGHAAAPCLRGFCVRSDQHADLPIPSGRQFPGRGDCFRESQEIGGSVIMFETGKLARLTSGAVLAGMSDTKVLATAVCEREFDPSRDFLPLTVDYREKHFAKGKIPGTFLRREGAPKEREILCSRSIDRSIRPLFPPGFKYEVQIMANVLCSDGDQDPDVLSINAASAALMVSDIPWNGPVGAVRIGRVNGHLIVNPDVDMMAESDLSLVYVCTEGKTMMVELQAREISNEDLGVAMRLAHSEAVKLLEPQRRLAVQVRHEKRQIELLKVDSDFYDRVKTIADTSIFEVLRSGSYSKQERGAALAQLEARIAEELSAEGEQRGTLQLSSAMQKLKKEVARRIVFGDRVRCDGRGVKSVREIYCESAPLPSLHGSALFSRGSTEVLCTVTIGASEEAQKLDSLVGPPRKRFMVHYSFPPFAVNEVGKAGYLNRREIGHGNLAEKALLPLLPPEEGFPFSVRVNSEVLASDGSSSMATVCGGSMALMDAGINLREHVAGVSIGLMTDLNSETGEVDRYQLLTDILGVEDYLGDMDFKIAGTRKGVTAIQLDIKLPGVPLHILSEALEWAHVARLEILDRMEKEIKRPREGYRESAPRYGTINVERDHIGKLIGPQGANVRGIQEKTGAKINISAGGRVDIFAKDQATFDAAKEMLEATCGKEVEVGGKYTGTVVAVKDFGAFIELPGGYHGLLHISELAHHRVASVQDVLSIGQVVEVMCTARDLRGNMKFSLKALLPPPAVEAEGLPLPQEPPHPVFQNDARPIFDSSSSASSSAQAVEPLYGGEKRKRTSKTQKASAVETPIYVADGGTCVDSQRSGDASNDMVSSCASSQRRSAATSGQPSSSQSLDQELQTVVSQSNGSKRVVKRVDVTDSKVSGKVHMPVGTVGVKLGQEYGVRIKKLKKYGALVETKEGLEGLVRFDDENVLSDGFQVGEEVLAVCADAGGPGRPRFFLKDV